MNNIVPKRWHPDGSWIDPPAPTPPTDATVSERAPDKVLYGPNGAVILRLADRPMLGFHRNNGRS